ncbi:hypothetical protein BC567DRAFT_246214 [Phyllosticta citribraziliensis]
MDFSPPKYLAGPHIDDSIQKYCVRAMKVVAWNLVYDNRYAACSHLRKQLDDARFQYPIIAQKKSESADFFVARLVDHLHSDRLIRFRKSQWHWQWTETGKK